MTDSEAKTTGGSAPVSSASSGDTTGAESLSAESPDSSRSLSESPKTSSVLAERELLANRYRIERELGAGGMGRVYRARDVIVDRDVAIKVLKGSWIDDPNIDPEEKERRLKRFKNEATAAGRISSPHVVTVYDVVEHAGTHFLVQAFIDGSASLHDIVNTAWKAGEWLDQRRVCQLLLDAALGLRAAHARGIVHRDIKPANMLVASGSDGVERLTIIDFGIALIQDDERLTKMDGGYQIQGTPRFIAPEIVLGGAIGRTPEEDGEPDARLDFFALGVVFYLALTYQYPLEKFLSSEDLMHALTKPVPPPHSLRPALNPGWALVLEKLYCPYRDGRYFNADELIRDVQLLRSELERQPPENDSGPVPSRTPKKTAPAAAAQKGGTVLLDEPLEDGRSAPSQSLEGEGRSSSGAASSSGSLANRALTQAKSYVRLAELFERHEGMSLPSLHDISMQMHTEPDQPVSIGAPTQTPSPAAAAASSSGAPTAAEGPSPAPAEPSQFWAAAAEARAKALGVDPLDAEPSDLFAPEPAASAFGVEESSSTVKKFARFLAGEDEPLPGQPAGLADAAATPERASTEAPQPDSSKASDRRKKVVAVVASLALLLGGGTYLWFPFAATESPAGAAEDGETQRPDPRALLKVKGRPAVSEADAEQLIKGVAYERDVAALQERKRQAALAALQQRESADSGEAAAESVERDDAAKKRRSRRRARRGATRSKSATPASTPVVLPEEEVSEPPPEAPTGQAATIFFRADNTAKGDTALVPTGTRIPAKLEVAVDSRAAKNVMARVTKAVKAEGKVAIPKGALITATAAASNQIVQLRLRNVVVRGKRHPLSGYAVQSGRPGLVARVMRTSDSERQRARGENDALRVGADLAADAVGVVSGTAGRAIRQVGGGQVDEARRSNQPDNSTYLTVRAGTTFEFLVMD